MADTLALWGVTRSAQLASTDFYDINRRSSSHVTFRVKNLSGVYTAQGVKVIAEDGDFDNIYLSVDGVNFAGTVDIGDLPPGAISGEITIRRITPSTATNGAKTCNLRTWASAWASTVTA